MRLQDFDFKLPESAIARFPQKERDRSKLLVFNRRTQEISHKHFYDLTDFLFPGDCLVINTSKVIPARLFGKHKERIFEILLLKNLSKAKDLWACMVRGGKKIKSSTVLQFPGGVEGEISRQVDNSFQIRFNIGQDCFLTWLEENGKSPLPPYIKRDAEEEDKLRYQTVYANDPGSVAAPTAGLHFSESLLSTLKKKDVHIATVLLHVGYGTFAPIKSDDINDHLMHEESFEIPDRTRQLIKKTRGNRKRIICVGTTSLRAIESMDHPSPTKLFITPGYEFKYADALITNFHLPKSSLFVLVSALVGLENAHRCYKTAIETNYRFYSYGDAMLVV